MIVVLLLVQLLLCAIILHREAVQLQFRNLATSIFFAFYAVAFIVEPLLLHIAFGGARSIMSGMQSHFRDPYVYYLYNCYGIALLVTSLLFSDRSARPIYITPLPPAGRLAQTDITDYIAVMIILGVGINIWATGMSVTDLLVASRFAWFDAPSFSPFWIVVSSYFLALVGIYAYQLKVSQRRNIELMLLCLAAVILMGFINKDRKWILFFLSGWLAGHYEVSGRKLLITRRMVVGLASLFVFLVLSQFVRDALVRVVLGQHIDLARELTQWPSFLIEYGDISYFYRASLEAIHQNINHGFAIPLALVRRIAFFFLPTSHSGGLKVEDISALFSDLVGGEDAMRRGNMPPGLFGLFAISFGWLASLVIIPFLSLLLRKLDAMFRAGHGSLRQAVLSLYVFSVVLGLRGDDSSAIYYVISTFLFVLVARLLGIGSRTDSPMPAQDRT